MKIGVNIVGISYLKDSIDWRYTYSNIKKNVISCWEDNEVKTYLTTYQNYTIDEMIELYNPTKICLTTFNNSDQRITYINSLWQLINEDIDVIVSTRFDINFHKKISEYQIDFEKFNFLFKERGWWEGHQFVTDNLFIFPKKFIKLLIYVISEFWFNPYRPGCSDLHATYNYISKIAGEENMNFLSDTHELSNTNSHYKLFRREDWKDFNIT